jgi:autotransporter-associated beta strand repeat
MLFVASTADALENPVYVFGTNSLAQSIGTGTENNIVVNVADSAFVSRQNGDTVISLYDYANITINKNATVQGNANSGGGGHFNSGPNVIEFNSHSTVTIQSGAVVQQLGSTTNGEAINAHGFGNNIVNYGTIHSANGAALWFQDTSTTGDYALRNTVTNYGTISTDKGDGYNVFGSSRGSGGPGLVFNNYGLVKGSLQFGNGNDSLLFGPGSQITGNVNGGGGTNDLTLDANAGQSATLQGSVKNFNSITKIGEGRWAILGQVPSQGGGEYPPSPINGALEGIVSLTVKNGLLNIVGAAPNFDGTVLIEAPGTLSIQAQSINKAGSVETNGQLIFDQAFNDTYSGKAITGTGSVTKEGGGMLVMSPQNDNTYSGGTYIVEGGLAVDRDSDLGASTGAVILGSQTFAGLSTNGTLRFDSTFDLASTRAITLQDGGGTFDTNGNTTNISQTISGTGRLTKAGEGTLNLSGNNTYAGGTTVTGGILGINSDAALGASGSRLALYDATTLRLNGDLGANTRPVTLAGAPGSSMTIDTGIYSGTLAGNVDGNGKLVKQGTGTLALYGSNIYQGGTRVEAGTLAINSSNALGSETNALELYDRTTLRLDGNVLMNNRPL